MGKVLANLRNLLLQATFFQAQLLPTATSLSFPPPTGPFNTTLTTAQLTDHSRLDPYAPTPQPRALVVSIFHPSTCLASPSPYMDPLTAAWTDSQFAQYGIPSGTFELLNLLTCPPNPTTYSHHPKERSKFPVVLFSPGLGNPRLYYSALAQQISSKGYIVVTIDHPYDAGIVVFSDNSTILGANITTDEQILADLDVRVKDVSFVLNQLATKYSYDISKAGIFGHSFGGATAASAMLYDSRLAGGVNLDGTFFGPVISHGLSRAFLIFAHEGKNITTDASWGAIWPKLTGWKQELILEGSAHGTFTDLPDIVDVFGLKGILPKEVEELLGSIDGARALKIVSAYVAGFFDFMLKGKAERLLEGESASFPEVMFGDP